MVQIQLRTLERYITMHFDRAEFHLLHLRQHAQLSVTGCLNTLINCQVVHNCSSVVSMKTQVRFYIDCRISQATLGELDSLGASDVTQESQACLRPYVSSPPCIQNCKIKCLVYP